LGATVAKRMVMVMVVIVIVIVIVMMMMIQMGGGTVSIARLESEALDHIRLMILISMFAHPKSSISRQQK